MAIDPRILTNMKQHRNKDNNKTCQCFLRLSLLDEAIVKINVQQHVLIDVHVSIKNRSIPG